MDIQEEREAFDQYFKEKYQEFHNEVFDENGDDRAIIGYSFAWSAWQAAKAQKVAVPEGFVLVPKEPTEEMIDSYMSGKVLPAYVGAYEKAVENYKRQYKAMIEAQEQVG